MPRLVWAVVAVALLGAVYVLWPGEAPEPEAAPAAPPMDGEIVAVVVPELVGDERVGQQIFAARCAECHGPRAGGVDGVGPPLIHGYYEPNHHADAAFFLAAERGVRAHHWRFGDMPPVEGITRAEVAAIVAFVRRVQRENGIF
ncbi:c-type cytochrome [Sinisalibacter aestuarii]|uniref:Cytochrome c domain-containing protein n=1 Tax=Sinisalibacter aestuarii TaxID=2949426 RepID=A0ABQ5LWB4_9RHOB|nr:cytochrome c [Sinisalibacter aestuarii]GKY88556.1 hypothetical protein STA1M1_24250 [Sinisalibacter aestuarii]